MHSAFPPVPTCVKFQCIPVGDEWKPSKFKSKNPGILKHPYTMCSFPYFLYIIPINLTYEIQKNRSL